jgi:hypothetical protein
MGLDLGKLVRNLLTGGSTYFKDQKKAKKKDREARDMVAENTAMMQDLYNQDYGTSALESLAADPVAQLAQQRVLARYGELADSGWTDTDRRALEQQQMQSRFEEQSQRQSVLDAAARRGDTSGGNALLSTMLAQQGTANRESQRGTDLALEGRRRALEALAQEGSFATGMRGQDFGEQVARGSAMDQFRQWGAGMKQDAAGMLANARLGQSQSLQQQAAGLRSTPNLDAAANAVASYYTMGAAGNVAGPSQPAAQPASNPMSTAGGFGTGHEAMTHTGRTAAGRSQLSQFGRPAAPRRTV